MDEASVKSRMQEVIGLVVSDVSSIRTGRATPALVEDLVVSVYGGQQKLKVQELATITSQDQQTIIVDPWDKSIIGDIKKGIESAKVGLNPSVDGNIIRILIPPLTTEDRESYVKLLSKKIENGKIMIRQIRGDAMRDIKSAFEDKELSEDEKFQSEKDLQKITDDFNDQLDEIEEKKKKEIMSI